MNFRREQYIELMTFGRVERQMFVELFGPLVGLEDEWRREGATEDEISLAAFDWDHVETVGCGGHCGARGGSREVVIDETAEYVLKRDRFGRRVKLFKNVATIPLPLEFPVRNMDDWLALKPMFEFSEERIDPEAVRAAREAQAEGALVIARIPGGFYIPRDLMGDETACLAYYDQPEMMHDILDTAGETAVKVLERVTETVTIDQLSVHEDLAGKSGPLVGPRQVEDFIAPYYASVWDLLKSRGTRIFQQDSDGNVAPVIDAFLAAGLTCMYPMEPAAGMDIVEVRKKYGRRLAFRGGIDKFILRESRGAIRRELEYKMQPLMREGGTVFGLDHRILNGTPIENYRYYVDTGREILGLPPRDSKRGWRWTAF